MKRVKARQHTKAKRGSLRSTCSRAAGPPLRLPVSAAPTLRPAAVPCPSLAVSRLRSRPSCVGRASRLPLSLGGPHRTFPPLHLRHQLQRPGSRASVCMGVGDPLRSPQQTQPAFEDPDPALPCTLSCALHPEPSWGGGGCFRSSTIRHEGPARGGIRALVTPHTH